MISGKTCLIGLLGCPVSHSLSPVMHNAALKKLGLDWCYLALPCETKDLKAVLEGLRAINCKGLNITIPHKETVASLCRDLSPLAKRLQAVNTLLPNPQGGWTGTNTDVRGFVTPLRDIHWQGGNAVVIGCGGSARAVVAGLEDLGVPNIQIIGRAEKSIDHFLKNFYAKCSNSQKLSKVEGFIDEDNQINEIIKNADLIVNTTPVGMQNSISETNKEMPLGKEIWSQLQPNTTLYDLIYTPRPTEWLKVGAKNGCKTIDGLEMLVQQGAYSLEIWSDKKYIPIEKMRNAAESYLKN